MVADNGPQHRRALAIVAAIQSYVADYSKPLVASAQAGERRARSVAATAAGKRRLERLRCARSSTGSPAPSAGCWMRERSARAAGPRARPPPRR